MRVLHVLATDRRRGAEVFASSLVSAIDGAVEQRVAILRPSEEPGVVFEAPTERLRRGVPVPLARLDLRTVSALRASVRRFGPDVVVAHGGEPLKYAVAADGRARQRVIYRRIGDASQFATSGVRERVYAAVVRRATRVVAVADALADELVDRYRVERDEVVVIPNGVDPRTVESVLGRGEVRASLGIPAEAQVVLSLGALTWEKDPLGQLDVVRRARAGIPDLVHVIAGDGPLAGDVRAAAEGGGVPTLVLGSRSDVGDLLEASDVLLLASRTEGMPACVIEAGMCGVPVVAYRLSGVPEVVRDGETGRLAPAGDTDALSQAVVEMLSDADRRGRMGEAARSWCGDRFDISVIAAQYRQLFDEVALGRSRVQTG